MAADQASSAEPVIAYIALGSNLGDRLANIDSALLKLKQTPNVYLSKISNPLENPAIGGPANSPPFLNAVAQIWTTLCPRELLNALLEIERSIGRERREKWGPRIIDLDIVLYDKAIVNEDDLTIPHPLMHERRFVLQPLAEIAPSAIHPVLKKTIKQLLERC